MGIAQLSSQGLVVVAPTIVDVLNDWFAFVAAVRKFVVIRAMRVKDRFDDCALRPPAPIHGLFIVIVAESLHDVLPKGLLTEIPLFELPFVPRHKLCERSKEAKVKNICIG